MRIVHATLGTITRAALHPDRPAEKTATILGNAVVSVDGREYAFRRIIDGDTLLPFNNVLVITPLHNSPVTIRLLSGDRPEMTLHAGDFIAEIREYDELFVDHLESPSETMQRAATLLDTLLLG